MGYLQHADSEIRRHNFNDMIRWIQLFGDSITHVYYSIESYYMSRIKTYEKGEFNFSQNSIYIEWFTFDVIKTDQSRTVMSLFQLLGNVGGIQQVFIIFFAFVLSYYAEMSFMADAINNMYDIRS